MRFWIVVLFAGCGPRCPGNDPATTSHEDIVRRRTQLAAELARPCLPARGLELAIEGAPIACASEFDINFALGPPLACWQIDATTGRIWPRPPHVLAGHPAIMPVDEGRIGELVVGPPSWHMELDDSTFLLAIDPERTRAVVSALWGGIDLQVFDLATRARIAHITSDERDDGMTDFAYAGGVIYRAGVLSNWMDPPTHQLRAWRDDGTPVAVDALPSDPDAPRIEGELLHSRDGTVLLPFCAD